MTLSKDQLEKVWAKISARAWTDEEFKKRLFEHPKAVLKEYGIDSSDCSLA